MQRLRAVFDEVSDGDLDRMGPFLQVIGVPSNFV